MTLARTDSGAEALSFETVDIASILREASSAGQPLADAKQIDFRREIPDQPILVEGDSPALRRLFLILIDNAVKYTPSGGSVSITLQAEGNEAIVRVRDTGIGISQDDLPFIFDRFYRADKARSRETGAGLGLSIARWIAQAHRASIHADTAIGKGSNFEIRLPLHQEASAAVSHS